MIELLTKLFEFIILIGAPIIQWLERKRLEAEKNEAERVEQLKENIKHEQQREKELSDINAKLKQRENGTK